MIVTFEGRFAKRKQDLICDLVSFAQDQMFPEEDDVLINFEAIRRKDKYYGDCMYEDENEFTVRLNTLMTLEHLTLTVLHEMVHVSQFLKGLVMDNDSEYWDRWQEKEAHEKEQQLMERWTLDKTLNIT